MKVRLLQPWAWSAHGWDYASGEAGEVVDLPPHIHAIALGAGVIAEEAAPDAEPRPNRSARKRAAERR